MVDLDKLERLHKAAQSSTSMMDTAAFIFSISHACDDGLLERLRTAERERDELSDKVSALKSAPWPEWAEQIKAAIRDASGYDGYDDAIDGVDLPAEVDDLINEFGHISRRAEAAETSLATLKAENERLRSLLMAHITDNLWNAYHAGFERDGTWIDGGMSDAEWLQRELGLEPGRHSAEMIKASIPEVAAKLVERAALETDNG